MKLISAFGAADMLELDRQTVRRALRYVAPDGYEKKQPRWRMKTIVDAVDQHLGRNSAPRAADQTRLDVAFSEFDEGCEALHVIADLKKRRQDARRLIALLIELDDAMRAAARLAREDDLRASLRCDQHFRVAMRRFESPCEWTHDECWKILDAIAGDPARSIGGA
ncbi:hypothetical protein [Bradyrhizobium sp. Arg816]|uniref:hypothetical protein n=1 Tax=Bradyrhizobium sp. Arg816 TaxID=2998491 RepID=UPI00249E87AD|nr:hypothetical protein [Bradyrhizobium sp. Arg816]MDI3564197.1 hypothetical protein [Bradyrhizobium sp. Arg816]